MKKRDSKMGIPKKVGIGIASIIVIAAIGIIFMAIFKLCPPIKSGPQPPWCVNADRFERDMGAIPGFLQQNIEDLKPIEFEPEDTYSPGDIDYFDIAKGAPSSDYKIEMGIGPMDFYWIVCLTPDKCVNPRANLISMLSRAKSLGSDFIYMTDFARFDGDLNIYTDRTALSQEEAEEFFKYTKKYEQKTMFVINLFLSDDVVRHSDPGKITDASIGEIRSRILDYGNPSAEKINKLFDEWEGKIVEYAKKLGKADYLVINPQDTTFLFSSEPELQNKRNLELLDKVRSVYDGKICFGIEPNYLDWMDVSFYTKADCLVVTMGYEEYILKDAEENVESVQAAFEKYFEHEVFKTGKETYVMQMMFSYDGAMQKGWFEIADYGNPGIPKYETDLKEQAISYEGFFRAVNSVKPAISGVFSYGYWWTDDVPEESFWRMDLTASIRNKDAEHVFYKWGQVLS